MTDVQKSYPGWYTLDDALNFDAKTAIDLTLKHLNQYRYQAALDLGASGVIRKAEGCHYWDTEGNEHLDFVGDVGVYILGMNNPYIMANIKKYLDTKPLTMDPLCIHQTTAAFAANMALITPELTRTVIVGGGGAEANETMLKMVKIAAGRTKKGKTRILSTLNSFHGKTTETVFTGGKPKWQQWQSAPPGHTYVPYGDLAAAEAEMAKGDVIAFIAEPIQGEGGIVVPPDDYFPGIRKACDKYDVYMLFDEVQAGTCRTGYIWAHRYYDGLIPDAFSFAKGISNGALPVGGVQAKDELFMAAYGSDESAFHHTATYQDNQISGAVALSAIQFIIDNEAEKVIREGSAYIFGKLAELQKKYPNVIKEVRGRGYMIGIKYGQNKAGDYYTIPVCATLSHKHRVHTMFSINDETICRTYPNFYTTKEDFDWYLNGLEDSIQTVLAQMGE